LVLFHVIYFYVCRLIFLVLSECEVSLGLSDLVSLISRYGDDYFQSLLMCRNVKLQCSVTSYGCSDWPDSLGAWKYGRDTNLLGCRVGTRAALGAALKLSMDSPWKEWSLDCWSCDSASCSV